jgi:hypothetical protein
MGHFINICRLHSSRGESQYRNHISGMFKLQCSYMRTPLLLQAYLRLSGASFVTADMNTSGPSPTGVNAIVQWYAGFSVQICTELTIELMVRN